MKINVAATYKGTRALGPGSRSVIWVQGCPFHCPGCIAPDWIPIRTSRLATPEELLNELLDDPEISGLTLSGGEPFLQATALAHLALLARKRREINIICFTGYDLSTLQKMPPEPGAKLLLDQIDVLIDGLYIQDQNDNRGMRGSANQKIHYLTGRLRDFDFESQSRQAEIYVKDGAIWLVGVPPRGIDLNILQSIRKAGKNVWSQARYHNRVSG